MKNRYVGMIVLLLFLLEGTLMIWLMPARWRMELMIAPHLVFVSILYLSIFRHRHLGLAFGLVFGLLHDIVYESPMLGAHGFSMAVMAYLAGAAARRLKLSLPAVLIMISLGIVFYDLLVFSLYQLFRITAMSYLTAVSLPIPLTMLFNLIFAVLIYVPARKWLEIRDEKRDEEA